MVISHRGIPNPEKNESQVSADIPNTESTAETQAGQPARKTPDNIPKKIKPASFFVFVLNLRKRYTFIVTASPVMIGTKNKKSKPKKRYCIPEKASIPVVKMNTSGKIINKRPIDMLKPTNKRIETKMNNRKYFLSDITILMF